MLRSNSLLSGSGASWQPLRERKRIVQARVRKESDKSKINNEVEKHGGKNTIKLSPYPQKYVEDETVQNKGSS